MFKFVSKNNINKIPKGSGVYAFRDGSAVLYIGKAKNLRERIKNHFQSPIYFWEKTLLRPSLSAGKWGFGGQIGFIETNSEIEALILEASLIKKYDPKYNVVWRDDKNYFYVGITRENFPKIFITHQRKTLKANYIGPFVDGNALKQTLKFLRKAFSYRTCNVLPKKPCLWYQLGRCPAPCILKSSLAKQIPISEAKMEKEYQSNVKNLIKIIEGRSKTTLRSLKKEMEESSIKEHFEKAGKLRDKIKVLEKIFAHSKVIESNPPFANTREGEWKNTEKILQKITNRKGKIEKIEAYDISNIQGQNATGSQVSFFQGKPDKKYYRKFRIQALASPNDVGMIREVLSRRLNHAEWPYPELILIDGGKPQLGMAVRIKNQKLRSKHIKVLAIAKRINELFIEGRKEPILLKNLPREVYDLILQLRDEAHRFAQKYHLKLRKKAFLSK